MTYLFRRNHYLWHAIKSIVYVMQLGTTPLCFISSRTSAELCNLSASPAKKKIIYKQFHACCNCKIKLAFHVLDAKCYRNKAMQQMRHKFKVIRRKVSFINHPLFPSQSFTIHEAQHLPSHQFSSSDLPNFSNYNCRKQLYLEYHRNLTKIT